MTTAIYVRVSTDRQALAHTIDQQIERLRTSLKGEDQELLCEQLFRDDGYRGATLNRPGLDRLRDQLREGAIDRVLMVSPDRLARNYVHQWCSWKSSSARAARSTFSISLSAKTPRTTSGCKFVAPWQNMNER